MVKSLASISGVEQEGGIRKKLRQFPWDPQLRMRKLKNLEMTHGKDRNAQSTKTALD